MLKSEAINSRNPQTKKISADLVIVGGGLSGVCCAITAARAGTQVILVQDRPVLGGNSSSEVRLWVLGATSHMGNNNRWAREGGVIDELLVENLYRNPDSNPLIFDSILLEKVITENNITLLLNTAIFEVKKVDSNPNKIAEIIGFCSQNSTRYELAAPLFCDASGDGIVGFLSGAAFRMGAESSEEFGEKFAPTSEYGELLGHSMYFYSKNVGYPVSYVAPSFALDVTQKIPKFRSFNTQDFGCRLWWIEYGGRLDTVHDTEQIKWELWRVIYGVWDYIKNSGNFPEAENLTLEWVGTIPGKRESRRFEGDYMLVQQDIVEQRPHHDDVAFGGWSIDLHPADGVFSEKPGCNQWHSKGLYGIPYRCFYSRNVENLFLAGRIISASHVAFGSSRVMATSAHGGQAVGMAAALCSRTKQSPRGLGEPRYLAMLQQELLKTGQHIPGLRLKDEKDLTQSARITATSELLLQELAEEPVAVPMEVGVAQMIPVLPGKMPRVIFHPYATQATELDIELRVCSRPDSHSPDTTMDQKTIRLQKGRNCLHLDFDVHFDAPAYAYFLVKKNEQVALKYTKQRMTGLLSVFNSINPAVSNYGKQEPTEDIGVDAFEFWCPQRRPGGKNLALRIEPAVACFKAENIRNGLQRPTHQPNAWVADPTDVAPALTLSWTETQRISRVELFFDTDLDHPAETVLMRHPENISPFCVRSFQLLNDRNEVIWQQTDNHQTRQIIEFPKPLSTISLTVRVEHPSGTSPASLFEVRCYS
ncbi:FAD-dependent oxidoreductase [Arundinibacter roseus]|uniref:FAD-dependent oxidoreductase n=1 Tax=Arundinibacter roseus TaxID=2070510 RepID=A0A4R4JU66_9BACT|nr:FAD-dependent oxidoreductase [Arundinibacter roseus]TDB58234.1 FAD-dependent oxidoreductase [Arundinibacter roseus]